MSSENRKFEYTFCSQLAKFILDIKGDSSQSDWFFICLLRDYSANYNNYYIYDDNFLIGRSYFKGFNLYYIYLFRVSTNIHLDISTYYETLKFFISWLKFKQKLLITLSNLSNF